MSVISRSALESSSLADLHEIASELGLDGYRKLRKADLIGAIIDRQGGENANGAKNHNGARNADGAVDADAADTAGATDVAEGTEDEGAARPLRRSR
ncbi:MAG: Rho termination factor N-terminal domain-containing protein, partial [Actinomycetota bacterium]|nr:Rho termination factor N-terminal domain-containing protein [Actinomycetota bacterium]